jgi:hypothetical protein
MSAIAIIDDNTDHSETLQLRLEYFLKKFGSDLRVVTQFPFHNIEVYFEFIDNNDIVELILDERLNDVSAGKAGPVNYKGSELVLELRKRLKDFPIFMVTTYNDTAEVRESENQFEYVISREEITMDDEGGQRFVPIFIRAAQRYLNTNSSELTEFNKLTELVATGGANLNDYERLKALQIKLELPMVGSLNRDNWLSEYEKHISNLDEIRIELEKRLKDLK